VTPKQPERAPSGTYQLKPVAGLLLTITNDAGLELDTDEFKLTRGGRVIVRVTLAPAPTQTADTNKPVAPNMASASPGGIPSGTPRYIPPGLKSADAYHLVFITSRSRDGKSAEIADDNQFVNDVADAAGLGPHRHDNSPVGPIQWFAIASTTTVAARDNARIEGPVYNTLGQLIASNADDLWTENLRHPIAVTENGTRLPSFYRDSENQPYFVTTYTGSNADGTSHATQALGAIPADGTMPFYRYGHVDATDGDWLSCAHHRGFVERPLYALSQKLTVPNATGESVDPQ
jgi:hypothetical protein